MAPRLRIAVADDDPDTREFFQELLERLGHEVVAAEDGRRLVEVCRAFRPDLVITDDRMPGLGGIEAAAEINRERAVPVLLVSARCDVEVLARGAGGHVVGCLAKPVKGPDLEAALARALARPE